MKKTAPSDAKLWSFKGLSGARAEDPGAVALPKHRSFSWRCKDPLVKNQLCSSLCAVVKLGVGAGEQITLRHVSQKNRLEGLRLRLTRFTKVTGSIVDVLIAEAGSQLAEARQTETAASHTFQFHQQSLRDPEASQMPLAESRSVDHRHTADMKITEVSRADDTAALENIAQRGKGQDRDLREGITVLPKLPSFSCLARGFIARRSGQIRGRHED